MVHGGSRIDMVGGLDMIEQIIFPVITPNQ